MSSITLERTPVWPPIRLYISRLKAMHCPLAATAIGNRRAGTSAKGRNAIRLHCCNGCSRLESQSRHSCSGQAHSASARVEANALTIRLTPSAVQNVSASVKIRISPLAALESCWQACGLPSQPLGKSAPSIGCRRESSAAYLRITSSVPSLEWSSKTMISRFV